MENAGAGVCLGRKELAGRSSIITMQIVGEGRRSGAD